MTEPSDGPALMPSDLLAEVGSMGDTVPAGYEPPDPIKVLPAGVHERVKELIRDGAMDMAYIMAGHDADHPAEWPEAKRRKLVANYQKLAAQPVANHPVLPPDLRGDQTKPTKLPKKDGGQALKTVGRKRAMESPFTQKGAWQATGVASGPVYKADRRALQLLSQLSQALINAVTKTQEVEAMVVNGRVLVSANETATVQELVTKKLDDVLAVERVKIDDEVAGEFEARKGRKLADVGTVLTSDGTADPSLTRGVARMARLHVDLAQYPDQRTAVAAILKTLRQELLTKSDLIAGGSPEAAKVWVTNNEGAGRIIVVDPPSGGTAVCSHAEQNLAYTLVLSGCTDGAFVAGGKRPCVGCWTSMKLVSDNGFNLTFNQNAGGLWTGTTRDGIRLIAQALGYDKDKLDAALDHMTGANFKQYVTARDRGPDTPRSQPLPNLRDDVIRNRYPTNTDSQSDSDG